MRTQWVSSLIDSFIHTRRRVVVYVSIVKFRLIN